MSNLENRVSELEIKILEKELDLNILRLMTAFEQKHQSGIYLRKLSERLEKLLKRRAKNHD